MSGDEHSGPDGAASVGDDGVSARPDEDDYDLLTYGEVAARMSELLVSERQRLADLRASGGDAPTIEELERRVLELEAGRRRYADHASTADVFLRRFGLQPRDRGASGG